MLEESNTEETRIAKNILSTLNEGDFNSVIQKMNNEKYFFYWKID